MKIGVLASGQLGFDTLKSITNTGELSFIATDSNSTRIIEWAQSKNIPFYRGNPRKGKLKEFIGNTQIDLILSVNYLFIIESDVIDHPTHIINFHGSLLPKYRGRTPHVWAIINGEKTTGVTAHCIDEGCDTGDIVLQQKVPIDKNDTGYDILLKFRDVYPQMVNQVIGLVDKKGIARSKQDHSKATFFGKRTPADGLINWNWSKERIRNWVRAQAYPYPGAFSFKENDKIIIDNCASSDYGFSDQDQNGLVLRGGSNPLVKTPNGAVELVKIRNYISEFNTGDILT